MKKMLMTIAIMGQIVGLSSAWACIPDYIAHSQFNSKRGEVSILLSEGFTGKKRAIYTFKEDVDGAIGLVALSLASKSESPEKLHSYNKQLQTSLTKFINYWSSKSEIEIPKNIKTALFNARKLLAKTKEGEVSENDFAFLSEKILTPIGSEKLKLRRQYNLLVYDDKGVLDKKGAMIGTGTTLSNQLPAGLFASAVNREVDRGGLDFLDKDSAKSCSSDDKVKTYAGSVFFTPQYSQRVPSLLAPKARMTVSVD